MVEALPVVSGTSVVVVSESESESSLSVESWVFELDDTGGLPDIGAFADVPPPMIGSGVV